MQMAFQVLLNLILAFIWMFLNQQWSAVGFIVGYGIGILILLGFRRFFNRPLYLNKLWAIAKLLLLFNKELFISSFSVARHILSPRLKMQPGIFTYKTELRSEWEVTILACLICLTPGTLTLEVSPDNRTMFIHAIDIADAGELTEQIRNSFERAILEVRHG